MEAIRESEPETIRFSFLTNSDTKQYLPILRKRIDRGFQEMVKRMLNL